MASADDFSDLSAERPLPYPVDLSQARPAPRCECADPILDDGLCHVCGLPVSAQKVVEAA